MSDRPGERQRLMRHLVGTHELPFPEAHVLLKQALDRQLAAARPVKSLPAEPAWGDHDVIGLTETGWQLVERLDHQAARD